jgi:putative acetyltransferase
MKVSRTNSSSPLYKELVTLLDQELSNRIGALQKSYDPYNTFSERIDVVLIFEGDYAIGCGVINPLKDPDCVEMKRVFLRSNYRGQGVSKMIVTELEKWAIEQNFKTMVLETGNILFEAIALYKKMGYHITENYSPYIGMPNSVCMNKMLI